MKTNDLKKGANIILRNGYKARIEDNKKGNVRMCTVFGEFIEMGSIYSHNIIKYLDYNTWRNDIEYTKDQLKCKLLNEAL